MKLLEANVSQKAVLRALHMKCRANSLLRSLSHQLSPLAPVAASCVRLKAFREWQATGIKPDGQKRSLLMGKSGGSKSRAGLFLRARSLAATRTRPLQVIAIAINMCAMRRQLCISLLQEGCFFVADTE